MRTRNGSANPLAGKFDVPSAILADTLVITIRRRHGRFDGCLLDAVQSPCATIKTRKRANAIRFCIFPNSTIMTGMEELFPLESSWVVARAAGTIALVMLLRLVRSLPAQNIILITVILLAGEGLLEYFLTTKYTHIEVTGPMWCFLLGAALLWTAVVLSSRRLAQFILRPWRRDRYYGFWLLAVSALVTALFQFGWPCLNAESPEAEPINLWKAAILAAIRGGATLGFLTCVSPWFIRKQPIPRTRRSELAQQPQNKAQ
jgi:hypothetical protein